MTINELPPLFGLVRRPAPRVIRRRVVRGPHREQTESRAALGVERGEQGAETPPFAEPDRPRALAPGGAKDSPGVAHPELQRQGAACDRPIREPEAPPIEQD